MFSISWRVSTGGGVIDIITCLEWLSLDQYCKGLRQNRLIFSRHMHLHLFHLIMLILSWYLPKGATSGCFTSGRVWWPRLLHLPCFPHDHQGQWHLHHHDHDHSHHLDHDYWPVFWMLERIEVLSLTFIPTSLSTTPHPFQNGTSINIQIFSDTNTHFLNWSFNCMIMIMHCTALVCES